MTLFSIIAILVALFFLVSITSGAPYLPTRKAQQDTAIELAGLKKGDTVIDLGSGDGAVLLAAAKKGINAVGYEINPVLWAVSWLRTARYRKLVTLKLGSFWGAKLPKADAVFVFLIGHHMKRLDEKLTSELTPGTKVISNAFKIEGRKAKQKNGLFLYTY